VEEAKQYAVDFVECSEIESLYKLYAIGWYLHSIGST